MTTALAPSRRLGNARRIAWYGVSAASASGAAATGSRSPSATVSRGDGTIMYSAKPPSWPRPDPRPPGPGDSHRCSSPTLQGVQRPHPHGP